MLQPGAAAMESGWRGWPSHPLHAETYIGFSRIENMHPYSLILLLSAIDSLPLSY